MTAPGKSTRPSLSIAQPPWRPCIEAVSGALIALDGVTVSSSASRMPITRGDAVPAIRPNTILDDGADRRDIAGPEHLKTSELHAPGPPCSAPFHRAGRRSPPGGPHRLHDDHSAKACGQEQTGLPCL